MNRIATFLLFFFYSIYAQAQHPPFWNEIKAFKQQDSISAPPRNSILFVGSSSFRIWTTMRHDFQGYPIVNRGFGGAGFTDLIRYADDIIIPYHARQIVLYCGDNDLASADGVKPQVVLDNFVKLFTIIRQGNEQVDIVFISIKPSPSRQYLMPRIVQTNDMIESFLKQKSNAAYVNVYDKMLDEKRQPLKDLFLEDMLHMNAKGYAIWKKAIQPYLKK